MFEGTIKVTLLTIVTLLDVLDMLDIIYWVGPAVLIHH